MDGLAHFEQRRRNDAANQDVVLGFLGKILPGLCVGSRRVPTWHLVVDNLGAVEDVQGCGIRLEFLQYVSISLTWSGQRQRPTSPVSGSLYAIAILIVRKVSKTSSCTVDLESATILIIGSQMGNQRCYLCEVKRRVVVDVL